MDVLLYPLLGVGVAGIYCVYAHYRRDRSGKLKKLRSRVAYMLWSAARKSA